MPTHEEMISHGKMNRTYVGLAKHEKRDSKITMYILVMMYIFTLCISMVQGNAGPQTGGGQPGGGRGGGGGGRGGGGLPPLPLPRPRQFTAHCKNDSMYVGWTHVEPYMLQGKKQSNILHEQTPHGVMFEFLKSVVKTCCGSGVSVETRTEYINPEVMESGVYSDTVFHLPVLRSQLQQTFDHARPNYTFMPIIETPGAVFIQSATLSSGTVVWVVISSCWPLLILVVTSAGIAGILIWILDTKWNPGQFPRPFIKGSWEGFWWAFVTMTTVGYGDRSPVSLPGRIFGIIWILVGLIILSIFTATVTSSITAGNLLDKNFRGTEIGVLNGTMTYRIALAQGGIPTIYDHLDDMLRDVEEGSRITGALVEYFQYSVVSAQMKTSNIDVVKEIPLPAFIGVSVYVGEEDFKQCLMDSTIRDRHNVYKQIAHVMERRKLTSDEHSVSSDLLSSTQVMILSITGVLVFLFAVFLLREVLMKKKKKSMSVKDLNKDSNSVNPSS